MVEEKDYHDIKAGVDGMLGDVPSPSDPGTISSSSSYGGEEPAYTEQPQPETQQNYYGTPTPNNDNQSSIDPDRIHEIIEAVVAEKWQDLMGNVGNIAVWKEKVSNDVVSIKQELVRLEERFDQLQNAVLGRVSEYDQGIRGINSEMKALEKVFEKILEPLTSNIKELSRITEDMKKKH